MATIRDRVSMPTTFGDAELFTFNDLDDGKEHIAVAFGGVKENSTPVVRVHSECLTGDVLGSLRCDCGSQIQQFLHQIAREGGVLVYLRQEGRGIGLYNKIAAYKLQETGMDTFEANRQLGFAEDERNFGVAAEMLKALGFSEIRLVTNNPDKVQQIQDAGLAVRETVLHRAPLCRHNSRYLLAKRDKGHRLVFTDCEPQLEIEAANA